MVPKVFKPLKFYCIWIIVGQGPNALVVCAGGGCLTISFFFLPLSGRRSLRLNKKCGKSTKTGFPKAGYEDTGQKFFVQVREMVGGMVSWV